MINDNIKKILRILLLIAGICLITFVGSLVLKSVVTIFIIIIEFILGVIVIGILYMIWQTMKNKK